MSLENDVRSTGLATERVLPAGISLWEDGSHADELAFVVQGELAARVGDAELGRIHRGEMVGEASAWVGGRRTAEVVAIEQTTLLVLKRKDLPVLKQKFVRVYDRMLDGALHAVARRIRNVDLDIATRAAGSLDRPENKEPSWWRKLVASMQGPSVGDAPLADVPLRMLPALQGKPGPTLLRLKRALVAKSYRKGEAVFLQDDEGRSVFLVAAGRIDVIRNVRGGKAVPLASLGLGGLFGTGAAILGGQRNASCIVGSDFAWVYELSHESLSALEDDAARVWKEALLAALRLQLGTADEQLAALERDGREPSAEDYDRILGLLSTYQGNEEKTSGTLW